MDRTILIAFTVKLLDNIESTLGVCCSTHPKIKTRLCSENKPLGNPSGCLAAKIPNFRLELKILFQMRGQITKFLQRNSKGRIKGNFEIYAPPRPTLTKLY